MGRKAKDIQGVYACDACHSVIDGRAKISYDSIQAVFGNYITTSEAANLERLIRLQVEVYAYHGHMRTLDRMMQTGVLKI